MNLTDAEFSDLREKASEYGDSLATELDITGSSLNAALDLLSGSNALGIWKLEASDTRLRLISDLYHKGPVRVSDYKAGISLSFLEHCGILKRNAAGRIISINKEAIEERFPEALMDRRGVVAERDAALARIDRESLKALLAKEERLDALRFSVLWEVMRGREKKDIISDRSLGTDISPVTCKKYIEDFRQRGLISPDGRPFPTRKMFSYMRQSEKLRDASGDETHRQDPFGGILPPREGTTADKPDPVLGVVSSLREAACSGVDMPRLFLLDPVSDAAVGEAMESILPQIVSLLGISEGLGGIGIEGLEVRRGCGRCYHDPGRKRVVADVDNMLAVGRTEDIVKGLRNAAFQSHRRKLL